MAGKRKKLISCMFKSKQCNKYNLYCFWYTLRACECMFYRSVVFNIQLKTGYETLRWWNLTTVFWLKSIWRLLFCFWSRISLIKSFFTILPCAVCIIPAYKIVLLVLALFYKFVNASFVLFQICRYLLLYWLKLFLWTDAFYSATIIKS